MTAGVDAASQGSVGDASGSSGSGPTTASTGDTTSVDDDGTTGDEPPPELPDWVPTQVGNAVYVPMTNALQDVWVAEGPQAASGTAVLSDYSGGAYNPYYDTWGGLYVHGGGHAATHDNSVFFANFNTLEWERHGDPTVLGSLAEYEERIQYGVPPEVFPDDGTNPREVDVEVPGSAHTYDTLLVLPPSIAGDPKGALIRPVSSAVGIMVSRDTGISHVMSASSGVWSRWSTNAFPGWGPGGSCALDPTRMQIWPINVGNLPNSGYLDLASRTYVLDEAPPVAFAGYPDMVYSAYHAARDIVVVATHEDGAAATTFYWFDAGSNGVDRQVASFVEGDLPPAHWGQGTLVDIPETDQLLFYTRDTSPDVFFSITVPDDPSAPWSWTTTAITGEAMPSTVTDPPPPSSMYRRMDYAPQLRSLVWATGASGGEFHFGGRVVAIRVVP
jgi:hypothetical protein